MLRRASDKKNMHVPHFPSMCLFTTSLSPNDTNPTSVQVRFGLDHTFDKPEQKLSGDEEVLEIPLRPEVKGLEIDKVVMHTATTDAYIMPERYSKWFSERFGFDVELDYIGLYKRQILGNVNPNAPRSYVGDPDPRKEAAKAGNITSGGLTGGWLDTFKSGVGSVLGTVASYTGLDPYMGIADGLSFADCAAFLVINWDSHLEAQGRCGTDIDVEKFRPNIVVEGAEGAWVEDYWGEIAISGNAGSEGTAAVKDSDTRIAFTSNCGRCSSINVDYGTGRIGSDGQGKLLKMLQSDRRVDPGNKYAPVFGRYGFLAGRNGARPTEPVTISVGDEVVVTKTNERRTHWCKWNPFSLFDSRMCSRDCELFCALLAPGGGVPQMQRQTSLSSICHPMVLLS